MNAAPLAEWHARSPRSAASLAYITVGTGIGGGCIIGGKGLNGVAHPEMGHVRLQRHRDDHDFKGVCPYHGDCLEGLASGPAIAARWGRSLSELPLDHPAHAIIANYLAQLCFTVFSVLAPGTIVLGGVVMETPGLLQSVRKTVAELNNLYLSIAEPSRIEPPRLGSDAGVNGALWLASATLVSFPDC